MSLDNVPDTQEATRGQFPQQERRKRIPTKLHPSARRPLKEQIGKTTERAKTAEENADHDPLTGLLNRRGFESRFSEEIERAKREHSDLVTFYMDINKFKDINEGPGGHPAGDEALVKFAELLKSSARSFDLIARMGGDEFVLIMTNSNLEEGRKYAEERLIPLLGSDGFAISMGASVIDFEHPEASLSLAEQFEGKAKILSRNNDNTTQVVYQEM